jgi:predicted metalloendopeptidase
MPILAVAILACVSSAVNAQQSSKHTPVLDVTAMDRTIDPCVDFFQYACGGWIKNNPIPPDQSAWDLYSKMEDENKEKLRGILEAAAVPDTGRNAVNQKIGDYYVSWMRRQSRPRARTRSGPPFSELPASDPKPRLPT